MAELGSKLSDYRRREMERRHRQARLLPRLTVRPVKMMNAGEILKLPPRLAPALSHKLRTFLQDDCTELNYDGSVEISLKDRKVPELLVAVREEYEAELKGLLPAGVQGDSVGGDVLAQLCFCLLLALAPSLPLPVAQSSLVLQIGTDYSDDWKWLGLECGEQALEVLCSALMSQHWSTPVRHLEIYGSDAFGTERACQHLAHLLDSTHCRPQSLTMTKTGTTANGTSHIARGLLRNTTLTRLELKDCREVGDKGVEQLAAMLRNNSTIQELSLEGVGMTGEGVGHLRDALVSQSQAVFPPTATGFKMLNISRNEIGQAGAVHLGAILANNRCSLRKLVVSACELEDEAGCLGEGLRTNNTLEELDIGINSNRKKSIGKKGMEALVRGLAANNTSALKILRMGYVSGVEWPAAELIAFMISSNQSLEELDFSAAPYSAIEWATIILPALSGNKTLTAINLKGCKGLRVNQVQVEAAFFDLLRISTTIGVSQVEAAFFDLLRINTTIETVNLLDTPLYEAGKAEGIKEKLGRNKDFRNALSALPQGKPKSCRLILCGNAYAGKSTLLQAMKVLIQSNAAKMTCFPVQFLGRLVCGQSSHDRDLHKRTRGIEIHLLKDNEDVRLSAWDLAGQREFHALHDVMFPNGVSAAALFVLTFNPIVSPGEIGAGKMKGRRQLEEELLYWLRLIASNYQPGTVAPSVVVVITNKDRVGKVTNVDSWFNRAQDIISSLKVQFDGLVNVGSQPFLVNALARQDPELKRWCSHVQQSLRSTLDSLPEEPVICTQVLKILQLQSQAHPVISVSEFAKLFSSLSKETKTGAADNTHMDKDEEWKPIAAYLHNCGEIIYHENLKFIIIRPRWFGHGVLGQLVDIFSCEGQGRRHFFACVSKPAVQQERPDNGFVTKRYLSWLLEEAMESVPGMDSNVVTPDQLIHLMLLMNLCYEETHGDPNTGYFLPAIFDDVGNKAAVGKRPRTWCKSETPTPTLVGRRLQCADLRRTFLTDGFFPRLQVVLHNHAFEQKWVTSNNSDFCTLEKNLVSMWVNGMDIIIEFSGSCGSFVDIMVKSSQSHDLTMEFVHHHFIGKIRSFCASQEGCQGVTLEERIIRPECLRTNRSGPMLCAHRRDQSVTVEELRRRMKGIPNYEHSWGEVKDEAGGVLLHRSADSGAALVDGLPNTVVSQALPTEQLSDCYPDSNVANGQKRGIAVLISMEKYDSGDRLGSAVDRGRLEALAGSLSLEVIPLVDSSAAELQEQLVTIQEEDVLPEDECFVCFLNAHGNTNQDGEHFITDRVGQSILLRDIVGPFRTCKKLRGKPKMFVVNSCRGTNKVVTADALGPSSDQPPYQPTEGNEYRYVEDLADCLVAFSTFGGSVSARDPMSGTSFVTALVEAFNSKRQNTDVFNIISSVNCAVVDEDGYWVDEHGKRRPVRQCPIVVSSLTKRFFLR